MAVQLIPAKETPQEVNQGGLLCGHGGDGIDYPLAPLKERHPVMRRLLHIRCEQSDSIALTDSRLID